ncbi:MAG: hypothetical protein M3430_17765, partial [Acidobacteriota bacterium]|nr:hypothetical protein [Acidobacteriota bacterium]
NKKLIGQTMPSQTSLTRHSPQITLTEELPAKDEITSPTMPSQTSLTRHSPQEDQPISPTRDFTKVANSIGRQAVPAGLFTGKSKQLYDCLYSLTRGAVVPARTVRISRPKLMKKSGIGSRVTFDANVERLTAVGLIIVRQITGEHKGNEYAVFLPEELSESMPSQTSQTSLTGYAQKLDRLVSLETSQTRHTLNPIESTLSTDPKTSFKTIEKNDDDEAFAGFTELMRQAVIDVTGKTPAHFDKERWRELAELLFTELKIAAARTTVSSVPSFLTEHLRRRLWKMDHKPSGGRAEKQDSKNVSDHSAAPASECPDCGGTGFYYPRGYESGVARCSHANLVAEEKKEKRLTDSEVTEQASIIKDLLDSGYTLDQAENQFGASLHQQDWQLILEKITE